MDCNSSSKIFVVRDTHTLHTSVNQPLPHGSAQTSPTWQAQDTQASCWTNYLHTPWLQCRLCLKRVLDFSWHMSLTEELLVLLFCCMSGIQHALRTWLCASLCDSSSEASWQLSPGFLSSAVPLYQMSYTTVKLALVMWQLFSLLLLCFSAHISMISVRNGQILSKSLLPEPSGRLCPSSYNVFLCCVKVCSDFNFLGGKLSIIELCFCNQMSNFIYAF